MARYRSSSSSSTYVALFFRFGTVLVVVLLFALSRIDRDSNETGSLQTESESPQPHSNATTGFSPAIHRIGWISNKSPIPRDRWPKLDNQTCLAQGSPEIPSEDDPFLRSPAVILIGAMKAGTSALVSYLRQHPRVMLTRSKELHFFDFEFSQFATENGILRKDARGGYMRMFEMGNEFTYSEMRENPTIIAVDDSPKYLFLSDRVPARVLCVTPWVKLLAVLRNPVDRAYSQYMMKDNLGREDEKGNSFEQWIQRDMKDLMATGVVQDKVPMDQFAGSKEEMEAWKAYTRLSTYSPIGRGLYAIQLRHWFQVYADGGRGHDDFMIIRSEEMHSETDAVYSKVLKFLNLEDVPLADSADVNKQPYKKQMNSGIREMLEKFYEPYNKELYELLGDEWKGVWDSS